MSRIAVAMLTVIDLELEPRLPIILGPDPGMSNARGQQPEREHRERPVCSTTVLDGAVIADGVSFRQCQSEADDLWYKPESPNRVVCCLVERPRAHLDFPDSAAMHLGKGALNQRPGDASSPPLVVHCDLVDLAPSPRGAEGILLALMKKSQHVAYGHAIFLGDPDQYRRFLEDRPKPRRNVFSSRRLEVFGTICDMKLMDEAVQNGE